MSHKRYWIALLSICALAAWPLANSLQGQNSPGPGDPPGEAGQPEDVGGYGDQGEGAPGASYQGQMLKIVPSHGTVPIFPTPKERQFRAVLWNADEESEPEEEEEEGLTTVEGLQWVLVATSADEDDEVQPDDVATLSDTGVLAAIAGGWVIVGLMDPPEGDGEGVIVAQTDTIWLAGGPTHIHGVKGGRAFADEDPYVYAQFPPNASKKRMTVHIRKRTREELPAQAQNQGRPVSIYEFDVLDAQTGEDIGGKGFDGVVSLTLAYDESNLPPGVSEDDLVVAYYDPPGGSWRKIGGDMTFSVDIEENTITIGTKHASYWAVMVDDDLVEDVPTAVEATSWGELKQSAR